MCGQDPPTYAWRADTGYLPPPGSCLSMPFVHPAPMYGAAPNPNLFFDYGDGPPGPIAPMQFGPAVVESSPPVMSYQAPPFMAPIQPVQVIQCQFHQCPCNVCGCPGPGYNQSNWRPGINTLQPAETTIIEVYWENEKLWGEDTQPSGGHKKFTVDCSWNFNMLLTNLMKARCSSMKGTDDPKGWAITEFNEKGGGRYSKGSTFKFDEDRSKMNALKGVGWGPQRGNGYPPVTCQLHKA